MATKSPGLPSVNVNQVATMIVAGIGTAFVMRWLEKKGYFS